MVQVISLFCKKTANCLPKALTYIKQKVLAKLYENTKLIGIDMFCLHSMFEQQILQRSILK